MPWLVLPNDQMLKSLYFVSELSNTKRKEYNAVLAFFKQPVKTTNVCINII
jgi:hypothetical protein